MTQVSLDFLVNQTVFRARQIERAVNDSGPWTISYNGQEAPAVRWVGEDRVIFRAHFPDACWIGGDTALTLLCRGEVVGSRPIETPDDGEFLAEWEFSLPVPVRA